VDLLVGGGAQDRQQEIVMRDLRGAKALALREDRQWHSASLPAAHLLLGHYEPAGQRFRG